eukprot:TRINITY_DN2928_c0_g1_i1.p1 TRINITY_DN2928_c0_g1~~TRINITY_DN2928_c0_g1_i1.p1  ORF type:complete len:417 (+),score=47.71 TRINITY_DN2928_c0_g1_i1:182-1252(+)
MANSRQMMEQDPSMDEENAEEEKPIIRTIPGIDHLEEWMIEELERKKRLIGFLEQIEDEEVEDIKKFWFPNGLDGVPNLDPYKRLLRPKEEEEPEEERLAREEAEFKEKSDPLHIERAYMRVFNAFKNAGGHIASYWKSTLRPALSIAKKTPEDIANEPLALKVLSSPYWLCGLSLVYVGASYGIYRSFGHKLNSVLMSYVFYKSAKMINNNELNGYRYAAAATAAAFLTSVSTTSQRRDLAPIYRPRYIGPRYFTLISIPFFVYYYNRIQSVPLVKDIQRTKEYIVETMSNSHTWFDKITARVRGDRAVVESLEKPHHDEDEDIDFLKEATQMKKLELRTTSAQRRGGGDVEDDE